MALDWDTGNNSSNSNQFDEDLDSFKIDMSGEVDGKPKEMFDPFANSPKPTNSLSDLNAPTNNSIPQVGSTFNNASSFGGVGMGNGMDMGQQPQQKKGMSEEEIFDMAVQGTKSTIKNSINLFKYLAKVLRDYEPIALTSLGRVMAISSGIITLGCIPFIFFLKMDMLSLMSATSVLTVSGVLVFSLNYNKSVELRLKENDNNSQNEQLEISEINNTPIEKENTNSFFDEPDSYVDDDSQQYYEESDYYEEEYDYEYDYDEENPFKQAEEELLDNSDDSIFETAKNNKGLITRGLLYESYTSNLKAKTPSFNEEVELCEEDDEWIDYEEKIEEVEKQIGLALADKDDDYEDIGDRYSVITSMTKGLMTINIEFTRPTALKNNKIKEFNTEFTNLLQGARRNKNTAITTITEVSGSTVATTVFTGEKPMVSLKDGLVSAKEFMLDSDNLMPVVLGYNEFGETIGIDMANMEGLIIAGKQRSGKSVLAKGIVSQLCQLNSPKSIQFYIGDRKGRTSDWYYFKLPHVARFESDPLEIVDMLGELIENEASRRSKAFSDEGVISIQSYHEACPDKPMPWIYVLLDEMISLATDLQQYDKENKTSKFQEYNGYMMQIATKTPNLGIRFIGVPHEVKEPFIKRSFANQIQNRIVFKGSPSQIEDTTGTKEKDFPYVLANAGECASYVPIIGDKDAFFMKAFMLGIGSNKELTEKDTNRIFEYQKKLWSELEEGSWEKSYWGTRERGESAKKILRNNGII